MDNTIRIYQKNTKTLAVLVQGLSDLTNYIPFLSVKNNPGDVSTILFKSGIVSDPSSTFTITLNTIDTSLICKDYTYDITICGNGNVITIVRDKMSVMENCYI